VRGVRSVSGVTIMAGCFLCSSPGTRTGTSPANMLMKTRTKTTKVAASEETLEARTRVTIVEALEVASEVASEVALEETTEVTTEVTTGVIVGVMEETD